MSLFRRAGPEAVAEPVLPYDIRYALQYRRGNIQLPDVHSLIYSFPTQAAYLYSKITWRAGRRDLTKRALIAAMEEDRGSQQDHLKGLSVLAGESIPPNKVVDAHKLEEISRRHRSLQTSYQEVAHRLGQHGVLTYFLAHSTLNGLRFLDSSSEYGVLYPPAETDGPYYAVEIRRGEVGDIEPIGDTNDVRHIMDDVEKTGSTREAVTRQFPGVSFETVY